MSDRIVLFDDHKVLPLVEGMELDRDKLIDVVRVAASDRALCTSNDIKGFELILMNAKIVRGLRDAFCNERWKKDVLDNQEGILNPYLNLRIIGCNFDHNTSNLNVDPTNLVPKGSSSSKKVACNATGWLPELPDIITQKDTDVTTWVLGTHVDAEGVLQAELSLPRTFNRGQFSRFETRIILLNGQENDSQPSRNTERPEREMPIDATDIVIRRK